MGRKDKLRREKQARQRKKENAAPVATTATPTTTAQATLAAAKTGTWNDDMFPKSEFYVQAKQQDKERTSTFDELSKLLFRGATEHGCIHSMIMIGKMYTFSQLNGRKIHLCQPWLLEGSIRGSVYCVSNLTSNFRTG